MKGCMQNIKVKLLPVKREVIVLFYIFNKNDESFK